MILLTKSEIYKNKGFDCYLSLLYGTANPSVLIGSFLVGISPYGPFPWKRSLAAYFLFSKVHKFKTSMATNSKQAVPYNKLLTNLASSSRTVEYWPSVVFVRTSLPSVRTDLRPIFLRTALMLS